MALTHLDDLSLANRTMRPIQTSANSVIGPQTIFSFSESGGMVSATYAGGAIWSGFLVGSRTGDRLTFRYLQADTRGGIQSGDSTCEVRRLPNGLLQVIEDYGNGTNVIEELRA